MDKLQGTSMDIKMRNLDKIKELFPNAVTEGKIDFDVLRSMLGDEVDTSKERYQFTWNGKADSIKLAQSPSSATLRPCKEKSKDWNTTENLYIEGDNLEVLKQLQKTYYGKIKTIYVDPPYNTGTNLIYKNDYSSSMDSYLEQTNNAKDGIRLSSNPATSGRFHSDWCSMIYPRLILSRNLLSDDGIIVLTMDDSEIQNVTAMMNEVFGEENHLATVVIKNNPSGRSTVKGFSINHEYALFYCKSDAASLGRMKHTNEQRSRYKEQDEKGFYEWENFRKNGTDSDRKDRPKQYFPIVLNRTNKSLRIPQIEWDDQSKEYLVRETLQSNEIALLPKNSSGIEKVWKYGIERTNEIVSELLVKEQDGTYELYRKKYMNEEGSLPRTWWDKPQYSARDNGTRTLTNLFGQTKVFDFPKAPEAVKDALIAANFQDGDIAMDFFSGSATTADAVMQLNAEDGGHRKYIMVQLPEAIEENSDTWNLGFKTICDIGEERIRRSGEKIRREWYQKRESKEKLLDSETGFNIDIGFKVYKLDSTNINPWDNEKKYDEESLFSVASVFKLDRSKEDILYEIMLKYGVFDQPSSEISVNGKSMYRVGQRHMIVCLEDKVEDKDIEEICKLGPRVVVFREDGFKDDNAKINAEYNLKQAGVEDVKCI